MVVVGVGMYSVVQVNVLGDCDRHVLRQSEEILALLTNFTVGDNA